MYVYNNILVIHLLPQLKMGDSVSCQLVSINTTDYIYKYFLAKYKVECVYFAIFLKKKRHFKYCVI